MLTILFSYLYNLNHILCIICISSFNCDDVRLLIFLTDHLTKQKKVAEIKKKLRLSNEVLQKSLEKGYGVKILDTATEHTKSSTSIEW